MAEQVPEQEQRRPQPAARPAAQRPARRGMTEEQVQATQIAAERKREAMEEGKVLTWPDLVYAEFLSAVFLTIVLFIVSLVFSAPLEEPSNPNKTPIPKPDPVRRSLKGGVEEVGGATEGLGQGLPLPCARCAQGRRPPPTLLRGC